MTMLAGTKPGVRQMRYLKLLLAVLLIAVSSPLRPIAAEPIWEAGPMEWSTVVDCTSIIFPPVRYVPGAFTWVMSYTDPSDPPTVGEIFYVKVFVAAIGTICSEAYVVRPELELPPGLTLAIDASTPVMCFMQDIQTEEVTEISPEQGCPQEPSAGMRGQYSFEPSNEAAWEVPLHYGIHILVPVVAHSAPLLGPLRAEVLTIDGNGSPWLAPEKGLLVVAAPPTPEPTGTPTPQPSSPGGVTPPSPTPSAVPTISPSLPPPVPPSATPTPEATPTEVPQPTGDSSIPPSPTPESEPENDDGGNDESVEDNLAPNLQVDNQRVRLRRKIAVSYVVSDDSGFVREVVSIYGKSKLVTVLETEFAKAHSALTRRVTIKRTLRKKGAYKLCVQAFDAAMNGSDVRCAVLLVR